MREFKRERMDEKSRGSNRSGRSDRRPSGNRSFGGRSSGGRSNDDYKGPRSGSFSRGGSSDGGGFRRGGNDRGGSSGGYNRGGSSGGYGRDRGNRRDNFQEKFDVVCDSCGKECQVPFKPTSSKPVYCDDCFKKTDNRSGSTTGSRAQPNNSEELKELNLKVDVVIDMLRDLKKEFDAHKSNAKPVAKAKKVENAEETEIKEETETKKKTATKKKAPAKKATTKKKVAKKKK
jgi:CxxC-x17-CxxC domain-containing protein